MYINVIYIIDTVKFQMMVKIINNTFKSNSAKSEGGALKFNEETPILIDNIFFNNSAEYGKDIAAFPCKLVLQTFNKTRLYSDHILELIYDSITEKSPFFLQNISRGYDIPQILEFYVLDQYDQIVTLDQSNEESLIISERRSSNASLFFQGDNPISILKGLLYS